MKRYYWSAISTDERIKAISEITDIIARYATILNFQRFSDISLSLILEIEEGKVNDLHNSLRSIMIMDCIDTNSTGSKAECIILFNITFTKGTGDMEIEVPEIPG